MKNASSIFQRCIETVLKGIKGIVVYQDDVLICADTDNQLKRQIKQVMERLRENNVTVNAEKCVRPTSSLKFLGYIFSAEGIKTDSQLTDKIKNMPVPTNKSELSSFIGLVTYYGGFVKNFAEICDPLYQLGKSASKEFIWNDQCEHAFQTLKNKMICSPILQPFSLSKHSVVTVDASLKSLGAVLSQDGHPNLYISRTLSPTKRN